MPQWPWRNPRPGVDFYGRSPLWYFAAEGDLSGVERALQDGADPTAADKDGYGALHVAAQNGRVAIVECLVRAGANVNAADRYGNGALWTACFNSRMAKEMGDRFPVIAALLAAGANPHYLNNAGRSLAMLVGQHMTDLRGEFEAAGVSFD
ncbi:MAG TPA: ankyrin repeat domain-containing protein [Sphingomicrobium sp.]|nr:ankyrin repeat domain-containing protein [Sphingomicrobium sp.]